MTDFVGYEVEIKGLAEQMAKLDQFNPVAVKELSRAMEQSTLAVGNEWRKTAPVGVSGEMRASIGTEVKHISGTDVQGRVGTSVQYGIYVEKGTRPHWPPLEPLKLWVQRKLDVQDVEGVARAIQRKIGYHGTKAQPKLKEAYAKTKNQVQGYFAAALERMAQAMEVKGGD